MNTSKTHELEGKLRDLPVGIGLSLGSSYTEAHVEGAVAFAR